MTILTQFRYSPEKYPVDLFGKITFGSSSAATLVGAESKGIDSVTKITTTVFLLSVSDVYKRMMLPHFAWDASGTYVDGTLGSGAGGTTITAPASATMPWIAVSKCAHGSMGCVSIVSATAGNYLTVKGVTFTAIANGATQTLATDWAVGTGGSANTDSALSLAATINTYSTAHSSWGVYAASYGAIVIIWASVYPVAWAKSGSPLTLSQSSKLHRGGFIFVCASAPNSGDTLRLGAVLSKTDAL